MLGMINTRRIKMSSSILEVISAITIFVNMHGIKVRGACLHSIGKSEKLCFN